MNAAIILSGGTGERMRQTSKVPKQYIEVNSHPILEYCLRTFMKSDSIDGVVIVANELWHSYIEDIVQKFGLNKFWGFAQPGETRQLSIYNGLIRLEEMYPGTDRVIIHDAVRPLVSLDLIKRCLENLDEAEGAMPVLPAKDTYYKSLDGQKVTDLLPRSQLFAGQAPEAFRFQPYLAAHKKLSKEDLSTVNGSSELAHKSGMEIKMIPGEERNFKVTTPEDLMLLKYYLESGEDL